jgi:hypothetical protein
LIKPTLVLVAASVLYVSSAGAEAPVVVQTAPEVILSGGISPRALPKSRSDAAPAALGFSLAHQGDFSAGLGLGQLRLDLGKNARIRLAGYRACTPLLPMGSALGGCSPARIGDGEVDVSIALPNAEPMQLTSRLQIFNGGAGSKGRRLWAVAEIDTPAPETIVIKGSLRRGDDAMYGTQMTLLPPRLPAATGGSMP